MGKIPLGSGFQGCIIQSESFILTIKGSYIFVESFINKSISLSVKNSKQMRIIKNANRWLRSLKLHICSLNLDCRQAKSFLYFACDII